MKNGCEYSKPSILIPLTLNLSRKGRGGFRRETNLGPFDYVMEIAGPKNLPGPIVRKVHDAFLKAMEEPEYQAVLKKIDMPLLYLNSEDCEKAALKELEKIGKLVQKLGLQNK